MNEITFSPVEKCIQLFRHARGAMMEAAVALYDIRAHKKWEDEYSTWQEFLLELHIDPAQASRLCSVVEHYIIEGKIEFTQIAEANPESLYKAIKLPGTPDQKALRAMSWTTSELRAELARKSNGDEHQCIEIRICSICHRRM